jgi:hypothetical protein
MKTKILTLFSILAMMFISQIGYAQLPPGPPAGMKTYTVRVFLEGFYNSDADAMNNTQNETSDQFMGTIADAITVELHSPENYVNIAYTYSNIYLNQNGWAAIYVPLSGVYYLTIKSRNHIETVSATTLDMAGSSSYDFTTAADKAYGNNQKLLESGVYGFYSSDVNEDGMVNLLDISSVQLKVLTISTGYLTEDINGNGVVNLIDVSACQTNIINVFQSITP